MDAGRSEEIPVGVPGRDNRSRAARGVSGYRASFPIPSPFLGPEEDMPLE